MAQISEETEHCLHTNLSTVSQNVTQEDTDTLCLELNNTMPNAANVAGIRKQLKTTYKDQEKAASLPWFNMDCIQERQIYLKSEKSPSKEKEINLWRIKRSKSIKKIYQIPGTLVLCRTE